MLIISVSLLIWWLCKHGFGHGFKYGFLHMKMYKSLRRALYESGMYTERMVLGKKCAVLPKIEIYFAPDYKGGRVRLKNCIKIDKKLEDLPISSALLQDYILTAAYIEDNCNNYCYEFETNKIEQIVFGTVQEFKNYCREMGKYEIYIDNRHAHSIAEELLKQDFTEQEFAWFIAKVMVQKYRLYDVGKQEYRIETQKLIEIAEKSNAARLRFDRPQDNSLRKSIKYIVFSSGLFSVVYKIEQLFGAEGVDEFINYLRGCYVENIWKGETMTRELNAWLKKHADLSKGSLKDNF